MLDKVLRKVQSRRNSARDRHDAGGYQKLETAGVERISDEDLLKYTGKTRAELQELAKNRHNVVEEPRTGRAPGFRGYESVKGRVGWGWA